MFRRLLRPLALSILSLALLHGCAGGRHAEPAPSTKRALPVSCAAEAALPEGFAERGSVLIFGEMHGVKELPAVFGEAVCSAASRGTPVDVGFELPKSEESGLLAYLASNGGEKDLASLVALPSWSRDYQDGRTSRARVDLLDRLRALRAAGLPVSVFLFDQSSASDQDSRERAMALAIGDHARAHPQALTMILVGEVHSWKTKGAGWDPNLVPMGWYLTDSGVRVRSLGRATPAGTAWICNGIEPSTCGEKPLRAMGALPSGRSTGVEALPEPGPHGYDGMYATPTMTVSPPAKASQSPAAPSAPPR